MTNLPLSELSQESPEERIRSSVEQRFGVLPNFFRLAPENPEIIANLWGFACFAYLDNPLPSLFKERLFVYLSRFCEVRYCITRHVGFLVGLGRSSGDAQCPPQTVEEVIRLIRRPFPRGQDLQPCIAQCAACQAPLTELPAPDSPLEVAMFACASHVFVQTPDAPPCLEALKHALGESRLQHLLVFLAFIRTAHYWSKVHSELSIEEDLKELLSTHERLAECLLNDPEAGACDFSQQLMAELISLRQDASRHDEVLRTQRRQNEERLRTTRQQADEALLASAQEIKHARDYAEATLRISPVPLLVLGFTVLEAIGSPDAFKICIQHPKPIDLLLADLVLPPPAFQLASAANPFPYVNGHQLAVRATMIRKGLRVILMSGNPDKELVSHGIHRGTLPFLAKPFERSHLITLVRHVLAQPAPILAGEQQARAAANDTHWYG